MTITNLEAIRLMASAILLEQQDKWQEAAASETKAKKVLDDELRQYLAGVKQTIPINPTVIGNSDIGAVQW